MRSYCWCASRSTTKLKLTGPKAPTAFPARVTTPPERPSRGRFLIHCVWGGPPGPRRWFKTGFPTFNPQNGPRWLRTVRFKKKDRYLGR